METSLWDVIFFSSYNSDHAECEQVFIDVEVIQIYNIRSFVSDISKFDPVTAFVIHCGGSLLSFSAKFLLFSLLDLVEISHAWQDCKCIDCQIG